MTGRLTTLGDVSIPSKIGKSLELGPTFCIEPAPRPPELVTLARKVAYKATEAERPRTARECSLDIGCYVGPGYMGKKNSDQGGSSRASQSW
ncbi:hypothetical protein HPB47_000625 [Ixodes persulcatus]|uniref:Uncharacterized protein n=1 Tax=Ixodes persulcatus TaxID=34615 RepID=A0AC60R1T3_IXOPE|nr:hypothetical protein HPB47_000625 [Ixodes persulcatus]